ncbi:PREDICTED: AAA-ATPase ASD, mitochondrial-like isoform X4 [Lupinus angustifolius]|nr:PREDICTED: AAA-ATPase ASD, mitochondrial-like isoform X1 [Lupinus angustifolius]XP_019464300.1 PREDICTED: AAA-ATPase ASD, mitochondrial-like isoform X2 [Lupinus angustifolius]XP_019464301.1 PREDICTED: AAA-ATPase ASD, mitochondrial-like isoform X3 [Lupinus angustifolius]XP_019464302.1 PREDICTED: AAA-ATPase ASD, mitochondrial-like isoform X4 [Lupinus angustifolius]
MMQFKMTEMWTTMGSTLASFMFVWAIIRQYCPYEVTRFVEKYTHNIMGYFYPYIRISFHEFLGDRLKRSDAYAAVEAYLSANTSKSAKRLKAEMGKDSTNLVLTMDEYERVTDEYKGVKVWWVCSKVMSQTRSMSYYQEQEKRFYKLSFHKRYRDIITGSYLKHVMREGKEIRLRNRQRKLYTNSPGYKWPSYKQTMWSHIVFEHPATFETMAIEPEKKREIIEDLVTFSKSKEFYARIGKAWKRGYLLHGPPGTGKSTMIAAMANLLAYDVYDLELTAVKDNTELRKLLIETTSKSIIVIEDIDCSLDLTGQRKKKGDKFSDDESDKLNSEVGLRKEMKEEGSSGSKVTLSGLLNFIDGIWSACGGERLIVFTTNYVEKLDPALIRRGRMDKHVELSYCTFEGFKVLANNYLKVETHSMFDTIKRLISEVKITPADVAENLMPKSHMDDADKCLSNLIEALEATKDEELLSLKQNSPINQDEKLKHGSHIKENGCVKEILA